MIEAYAFLAMFAVQILAISVLHPAWFIARFRAKLQSYPADLTTQLGPRVERILTSYRAVNIGIAVLGLFLLARMYAYTRRPDWTDGPVEALLGMYFLVQMLPLGFVAWLHVTLIKELRDAWPARKRKAVLERRGLFDFVSPFSVFVAVHSYILFAGFVLYIQQNPFPGFAGYPINIGIVTLVYALNAFVIYTRLYGRKRNPLETHEDRVHTIGLEVKASVYSCIAVVVFLSINFTLVLLDLQRWEPFAQSIFFILCALLGLRSLTARPGGSEAEGLRSSPAH